MEQCLYKLPIKGPQREAAAKLGARWRRGIFLGFNRASSEYLFWDGNQIARSRAVQRLKKGVKRPKEAYDKVNKDPHSIDAAMDPERLVPHPDAKDDRAPVAEPSRRPQNVQIRMADWLEHGSTPGCSKCTSALEQGWGVYGGSHSKACI